MKKALLGSLVSAALLTSFNLSAASASQAVDAQAATDNASKVSQQKIDSYADSAESALAQYKAALRQVDSLRTYNEQVGKMVDSQSSELASMQRQIAQIDQTSTEVVPLMLKMIDSLEQFVALDLPFQKVEREDRVAALTDLMNRADVTISEKYRKILEAYQIEEGFSRTIESYKASLAKDGGEKTYEFLRVTASPCSTSPRTAMRPACGTRRPVSGKSCPRSIAVQWNRAFASPRSRRPRPHQAAGSNCGESIMKGIKLAIASLIAGATLLTLPVTAAEKPVDLNALLNQVKAASTTESQLNKEREARFLADKNEQAALLVKAKAELAAETAKGERLKATFDANDKQLTELTETLRQRAGNMGEMFGVLRQFAGEFKGSSTPLPAGSSIRSRPPC